MPSKKLVDLGGTTSRITLVAGRWDTGPTVATFSSKVLSVVRRIPPGRVATYGDVAALAGSPRAARAVGGVMRGCRDPSVPCHRVIAAGGALGGFGGHLQLKRERLRSEGLEVGPTRVCAFGSVRWTDATPGNLPHRPTRLKRQET